MSTEPNRVISISLTETEWRAFVARQPKPVDWIRTLILLEVAAQVAVDSTAKTRDSRLTYN